MLILKPSAKVTAKYSDSASKITFDGVNANETSETNAVNQLNKLFFLFGKSVVDKGLTMAITKEVGLIGE